jgi:hypothetical protein
MAFAKVCLWVGAHMLMFTKERTTKAVTSGGSVASNAEKLAK